MSTDTDPTDTRASYVPVPVRFDFDALAPATSKAVADLHQAAIEDLAGAGVDPQLVELVRLRASQINGCAYCLQLHLNWARKAGVPQSRLDRLAVWRDAADFTERERAALAWTEALTDLSRRDELEFARQALVGAFSAEQLLRLAVAIAVINAWNRIAGPLGFTPAQAE